MAYEKLNLRNGTVVDETHVAHIEDGIYQNSSDIADVNGDIKDVNNDIDDISEALAEQNIMDYVGESIPSGADLNDYTTPGKYYSASGTITSSLSNAPSISYGFTLIVIRTQTSDRRLQLAIDTLGEVIYERGYGDTAWSNWVLIVTTAYGSKTATVNTAGYLTSSGTNVLFTIPITKKDGTISSITTSTTQIRQNGTYLTGSSDGTEGFPSGASTTFSQTDLGTRVTWVFPSSIGGTNNDAVGVCGSITVTFK